MRDYLKMSPNDARMTSAAQLASLSGVRIGLHSCRQGRRKIPPLCNFQCTSGDTTMSPVGPAILAAALVLSRLHGVQFAAFFLLDRDVSFDVIKELLLDTSPSNCAPTDE